MTCREMIRLLLIASCFLSAGCAGLATQQTEAQLSRVAKDWCLTIRASEVIPIYPLTEDVQPGDVFLVTRTIDQENALYEKSGFLPLSNLVARLPLTAQDYANFYGSRYALFGDRTPPGLWQFPTTQSGSATQPAPTPPPDFSSAPRAAFPSYTFDVSNGESFNLGIPIHAVPVGLAILNTSQASGSVQLTDAYTYGLDLATVNDAVTAWQSTHQGSEIIDYACRNQRALNLQAEKSKGLVRKVLQLQAEQSPVYLRVVTRVYLVGGVNVSLARQSSGGVSAEAGKASPLDISNFAPSTQPTTQPGTQSSAQQMADAYKSLSSALTSGISNTAAGGSLSLVAASSGAVSMNEQFPRPLVVGYLAYDLQVNSNGTLSQPYPTLVRVNNALQTINGPDAAPTTSSDAK